MPNTYAKLIVQNFVDKVEALKKHEEKGLQIENMFSNEAQTSVVRQVSIAVYQNVLEMLNDHFKLTEEPTSRKGRGGRKPGSKNRTKEVNKEIAAGMDE